MAKILTDTSKLSIIDQLFFRFESLLSFLSGVVIFMLIALSTFNVLGRWIFNFPVDGYIDWVEQAMAFFAFLGIAFTQREGGHIRMDVVMNLLHGRRLWLAELTSVLFMLFITLILIYGSFLHFMRAYQIGDSSMDINLPIWPAKLVIPISLSILALRLFLQIWGYIRAIKENNESPVAVPLIESAASIAKSEAESVSSNNNTRSIV